MAHRLNRSRAPLQVGSELSVWSLCVSFPCPRAFPFGFLLQSKVVHVRLIGGSKLPVGVNVEYARLFFLYIAGLLPVHYGRPFRGCPASHPMTAEIGSSPLPPSVG